MPLVIMKPLNRGAETDGSKVVSELTVGAVAPTDCARTVCEKPKDKKMERTLDNRILIPRNTKSWNGAVIFDPLHTSKTNG